MINPYQIPNSEPVAPLPDLPEVTYHFAGEVSKDDIKRHIRGKGIVLYLLICLVFGGFALAKLSGFFQGRPFSKADLFSLSQVLFFFVLNPWFMWWAVGPPALKRTLAKNPFAIGPRSGFVSNRWIRVDSPEGSNEMLLEALSYVYEKGGVLGYSNHANRLMIHYLAKSNFREGEFEAAVRMLSASVAHRPPVPAGIVDARKIDPNNLLEMEIPADAIRFSASVTKGDMLDCQVMDAAIKSGMKRNLFSLLIIDSVLIFVGLFMYWIAESTFFAILIAALVVLLNIFFARRLQLAFGTHVDRQQTLLLFFGGMDSKGLYTAGANQRGFTHWFALKDVNLQSNLVSIGLQGTLPMRVILPRRSFETETDWQAALALLQEKLPVAPARV